jgi:hypothetical protein
VILFANKILVYMRINLDEISHKIALLPNSKQITAARKSQAHGLDNVNPT